MRWPRPTPSDKLADDQSTATRGRSRGRSRSRRRSHDYRSRDNRSRDSHSNRTQVVYVLPDERSGRDDERGARMVLGRAVSPDGAFSAFGARSF